MLRALVLSAGLAAPAFADCPPAPDVTEEIDAILAEIRLAKTEIDARLLGNQLWEVWARAPDAAAQEVLNRGMRSRAAFDFLGALSAFDELIAYCPDYAEGYNQRAFVNFIRGDYPRSLEDLELALERSPRHVAAMTGKALTLMQLGRIAESQALLREALELNPWLPERAYLIEGYEPDPGEKL